MTSHREPVAIRPQAAKTTQPSPESERGLRAWLGGWTLALKGSLPAFAADHGLTLAAALSYYLVISLFPLILLLLSISGLMLQDVGAQGLIIRQVTQYLPGSEIIVSQTMNTVILARGPLAWLAALGLLWTTLGMFSVVDQAINTAWRVTTRRGYLRTKLISLTMFGALSALLLLSVAVTSALHLIAASPLVNRLESIPGSPWLWTVAGASVSILGAAAGFILLYRFLPSIPVRWAEVWPAGLLVAALWEAGKWGFLWYLSVADYSSIYGQIGTVVALLVWGYFSGIVFIWGAELGSARARARRPHAR
jgi:membrane protein